MEETSGKSESATDSGFVCECHASMRSACRGLPFYGKYEGMRYCVLHYPGKEKSREFKDALRSKIKHRDFNFRGVSFPRDWRFRKFNFNGKADFSRATFNGGAAFIRCTFSENVTFFRALFRSGAYFNSATFTARANFGQTTFCAGANFDGATFGADTSFRFAEFKGELSFKHATFNGLTNFCNATFGDYVRFEGRKNHPAFSNSASLNLQFARIEKPDHIVFHTLTAYSSWFVNVDARKFEFTNVDGNGRKIKEEIAILEHQDVSSPYLMLSIACRNLAVNAEENHRYEDASKFRYMAMNAGRLEHWHGWDFRRLSWWYWLASGYSERVWRASVFLIGILLVSAVLYTLLSFPSEPNFAREEGVATVQDVSTFERAERALIYSAAVMTLQKPDPRPATPWAQTVVLLETILGPVQAALLALAIRRKFMR